MTAKYFDRREFLRLMGAVGAGALTGAAAEAAKLGERQRKPNIVFIMTDDHAAHSVGCYGSRVNKTPNMDRLAQEGMRFTNCFCTNALCAPSRSTLLTGKYSHKNGLKDNTTDFDGSQMTFPKLLQKAGYQTILIGKWHLRTDPTGFDYWNILPGQGIYRDPDLIEMGTRKKHTGYATEILTDIALEQMSKAKDKPFCLLLHHKAPHRLWESNAKNKNMFEGQTLPEPPTFNDDYSHRSSAAAHADMRIADMPDYIDKGLPANLSAQDRKKWNYQRFLKDYLRAVAAVDDSIGRVLDYLDDSGLAKNTIVIYTSDNGFFLGDHGWFDKRFMYEQSLRVPFIVRYPDVVRPGSRQDNFVINTDYAPTFLDFAGVKAPEDMQGRSIKPLLKGKAPRDWRKSIYYRYYEYPLSHRVRPHYGVRTDRYKLIHYDTIDEWELFDLEKDPNEMRSVYSDPDYANVVKDMKAELERLRKELKDI